MTFNINFKEERQIDKSSMKMTLPLAIFEKLNSSEIVFWLKTINIMIEIIGWAVTIKCNFQKQQSIVK